ncbi:fimbrial protein [Serratia entomophila]|uniref:fimbrial protein n=1 Tax=Serratia entomophila TaxID=42906 RepID=UPI002179245A|nr:fimbrial protein [Serratia entomophila]CAI0928022.1 Minor fimbrial protein prsF precursor [Serratia entomophila]CAI1541041.1 Minor fimbrial protein prsF precursor [Serratia entomophila]CAI1662850.1 Minor fimbrial protein prsF precursor [Serratia entomophila]CAI1744332.1 Minor fimbrial protein prsF precursor [Serratia entomophila]CAI1775092.1 Minor fimbrial protein prsF precursor [Serratia entomophila]
MKLTLFRPCWPLLMAALCALPVQAAYNQQQMQFRGTLNEPPPCTIDNGQQIEVNFGDRIGVNKVDGQNYLQTVNYEIRCEPGSRGLGLGLKVSAIASAYDRAAIQTNLGDLAIQLQQNGQPMLLNQRIAIDAARPPVLQVVPVQRPGAALSAGAFRATATLLADYQ